MKTKKIPNSVANGCPKNCPKCNKRLIAVFRTWKGKTGKVTARFHHEDESRSCSITYKF